MTTTTSGCAAIQRYKIGYHPEEWSQRSRTPSGIPDASGSWVRYADHVTALAAGQATAAPAQPAAQQGVAYAALPTSSYAGRVYEEGFLIGTCPLYTADQLHAFADATHTLRASHGQAPADSVQEDAALWHWLAEYLVGTRTDLDDEIVASETVNDLRKLVEAARKQGEKQ